MDLAVFAVEGGQDLCDLFQVDCLDGYEMGH